MKEKLILITMKMKKNQKYDDPKQCMKEGMHRVSKLIENWADERSISGVVDIGGMVRIEDYGELDKWMYQPRVIGRYSKRTQMFFKILTQLSV